MLKGLEALEKSFGSFSYSGDYRIIEKELKALDIIKKYYIVQATYDDLFPYELHDEQYCSSGSCLVMDKEEFDLLQEVLNGKDH